MPEMTPGQLMDFLARRAAEDASFRRRLLADPREALAEVLGQTVPDQVTVRLLRDTATTFHIVLPHTIRDGEELSDADLAQVCGGWDPELAAAQVFRFGSLGVAPLPVDVFAAARVGRLF
ncbi:MAG: NHLP leader peptide family RiPP precursor [Acidobacteriota bacterium]